MKKIIIGSIIASVFGLGIWLNFKFNETKQLNDMLNQELMQAKLEIGKAHTEFGKSQEKIKLLDKQLQDEIKVHKELIKKYGILNAKYNAIGNGSGSSVNSGNTTIVIDGPEFVPGNIYVAQDKNLVSSFSPPLNFNFSDQRLSIDVSIFTTFKDDFILSSDFKYDLNLKIMAQFIETITESGAVNNYANIFEVDNKGNKIGKFKLTNFEVIVQDQRKSKFHWLNPKIDVGVFVAYAENGIYGGDFGVSLFSYGLTKNDLTWRFARFGLAINNSGIAFELSPAIWNVGDLLPIIQNLWISPGLIFDINKGRFGIVGSLGVSL